MSKKKLKWKEVEPILRHFVDQLSEDEAKTYCMFLIALWWAIMQESLRE